MRPLASFMRTDLPQPAGPRMMRVSPRSTEKEMSFEDGLDVEGDGDVFEDDDGAVGRVGGAFGDGLCGELGHGYGV